MSQSNFECTLPQTTAAKHSDAVETRHKIICSGATRLILVNWDSTELPFLEEICQPVTSERKMTFSSLSCPYSNILTGCTGRHGCAALYAVYWHHCLLSLSKYLASFFKLKMFACFLSGTVFSCRFQAVMSIYRSRTYVASAENRLQMPSLQWRNTSPGAVFQQQSKCIARW